MGICTGLKRPHRPEEPVLGAVSRRFCASQRRLFTGALG